MKLFLVSQDPRFDPCAVIRTFSAMVQQLGLARTGSRQTWLSAAH